MTRRGIACAGNWILDIVHDIPVWPEKSDLVRITKQTSGLGGGPANVAAGLVAMGADYPVVPVGLVGTDKVQPVGSRLPSLAKVRVAFGRPISPERYAGMPAGRARRELTDEVMTAIAALSGQERVDAYNELPPESGAALAV